VSSSYLTVESPPGIEDVTFDGEVFLAKPSDNTLHQSYSFFIKVSAYGGSTQFFGPAILNVGCFDGIVWYTDSENLVESVDLLVGDALEDVYVFVPPVPTIPYCVPYTNVVY